jgi:hypothetical protein
MALAQDDSVLNPLLNSCWQKYRDSAPRTINFPTRTVHKSLQPSNLSQTGRSFVILRPVFPCFREHFR